MLMRGFKRTEGVTGIKNRQVIATLSIIPLRFILRVYITHMETSPRVLTRCPGDRKTQRFAGTGFGLLNPESARPVVRAEGGVLQLHSNRIEPQVQPGPCNGGPTVAFPVIPLSGRSGSYSFTLIPWGHPLNAVGAVYVALRCQPNVTTALYVGQTNDLRQRFADHEHDEAFSQHGATHLAALVVTNESQRLAIEGELIASYDPPINTQMRPGPFARALMGR